ncbi:unnamed protein product [Linum trigynum]|uniref:Uncharacterized protein n=1 Tax=Linum trigynum TaxID=586398 RepID=A0AAV2F4C5_9ROSI
MLSDKSGTRAVGGNQARVSILKNDLGKHEDQEVHEEEQLRYMAYQDAGFIETIKAMGLLSAKQKKAAFDDDEWNTLEEKAHLNIMLLFSDDVIIEVSAEKTVAGLWLKLKSLYMMKSLTNKLHLKQRLFSLRMQEYRL